MWGLSVQIGNISGCFKWLSLHSEIFSYEGYLSCRTSKHYCLGLEKLTFNDTDTNTIYHVCEFSHGGKGLEYQIVAGPVFNNLYPFAGIFTGFLADYGRRTIWLVVSLVFWSVITGVTGLVRNYWQLVITRSLLAIG